MMEKHWKTYPLISCTINVTENCNLACKYCFTWGKTKRKLPLEIGKQAIDFMYEMKDPKADHYEISFWGGEPLLEFEMIKKLINYAEKKFGSKVIFGGTTNGILLDEYKLKYLRDHRAKMMISLDGTKEYHDKYRVFPDGRGSWDFINIPLILEIWPDARFRISLTKEMVPRFSDICIELYEKYKMDWLAFSPVYEHDFTDEDFRVLGHHFQRLREYLSRHPEKFCYHITDPGRGIWQDYPCGAGRTYIGIGVDGKIYPCHRFEKFGEENRKEREQWCIGDIWNGFNDKRQMFLDYPKVRRRQCVEERNCVYYPFCAGGCYAVTKDLSPECSIFGFVDKLCKYTETLFYGLPKPGEQRNFPDQGKPCVCYNCCYEEGTENEIFYRDRSSDISCVCYNTNYTGHRDPQFRRLIRVED